jgi:hypothetical protein
MADAMGTTVWHVADPTGIQWKRASVPSSGGVLPVEVTRLGAEPPWTTWRLERTAFEIGAVEGWFTRQLKSAEAALLAYVQDGDFAYVTALSSGTVAARLVAGEPAATRYKDGAQAIARCTDLHGGAWREAALDRLAMWSHLTPQPAPVGSLREAATRADAGDIDPGTFVAQLLDLLGLPGEP